MEHTFVSALLLMFLMADPLGNIPIFISALKQVPATRRTKIIIRECAIAALILSVFAFGGRSIFECSGPQSGCFVNRWRVNRAFDGDSNGISVKRRGFRRVAERRTVYRTLGGACHCRALDFGNNFGFGR